MRKRCTKCRKIWPVVDFNFRDKGEGIRKGICKICTRKTTRTAYYKKRIYYLKRVAERNSSSTKKLRLFLYQYLCSHSCVDCGIQDPVVLQFDHVRGKKRDSVANMASRRFSPNTVKAEIKKCEIRCANCHTKKTARERGYYKYLSRLD